MKKLVVVAAAILLFAGAGFAGDLNIKAGFDTFGNTEIKGDGGDRSVIMDTGFSITGEYLVPVASIVKIGGGLEYQFERPADNLSEYADKIGYVPVFATIQINPIKKCEGIYFKGNVGYNVVFRFDPRDRRETKGGLYYGLGSGYDFKCGLIAEMMYGMYSGTIDNNGHDDESNYSKLAFNVGYKFKI